MRREGYEFQVSRPEVIFHPDEKDRRDVGTLRRAACRNQPRKRGHGDRDAGQAAGEMTIMSEAPPAAARASGLHCPHPRAAWASATNSSPPTAMGVMKTIFDGYGEMAGEIGSRPRGSPDRLRDWRIRHPASRPRKCGAVSSSAPASRLTPAWWWASITGLGIWTSTCRTKTLTSVHTVYFGVEDKMALPREIARRAHRISLRR